jgi:uncharacterized membrane protein (DUF485 family)
MTPRGAETLAWVFIYSGLLLLVLGVSVISLSSVATPWLAWALLTAGTLDAALGVGLIIWRSKMKDIT